MNELRHDQQEAALLALLTRVEELERALDFEVHQREAMEAVILRLAAFGKRLDRLELLAKRVRREEA